VLWPDDVTRAHSALANSACKSSCDTRNEGARILREIASGVNSKCAKTMPRRHAQAETAPHYYF